MNRPVILDAERPHEPELRRVRRRSLIGRGFVVIDGKRHPCRVRNLSDAGAQLVADAALHIGQVVALETDRLGYRFATVQWREGQRAGISFGELPDDPLV